MNGTAMEVVIALGLVVTELNQKRLHNKLITFSEKPTLHTMTGATLRDRVAEVSSMNAEMTTNLFSVFKLLLREAEADPNAQMVEKLFIFSDMQFDEATCGTHGKWKTTYDNIYKMYAKTKLAVPKILFWNLRAMHKSFPVEKDEQGKALISGLSKEMMKASLGNETIDFSPLTIMNEALAKYEITEVPKEERASIAAECAGKEAFCGSGSEGRWVSGVEKRAEEDSEKAALRRLQLEHPYAGLCHFCLNQLP